MRPPLQARAGRPLPSAAALAAGSLLALLLALAPAAPARAQEADAADPAAAQQAAAEPEASAPDPETGEYPAAEVLVRVQQILAEDRERLEALGARSRELARQFEAATERFNRADAALKAAREAAAGSDAAAPEAPESEALRGLRQARERAREELDPLLQRRQAVDQQLEILRRKIAKQEELIELLLAGPLAPSLAEEAVAADAAAEGGDAAPAEAPPAPARPSPVPPTALVPGLPAPEAAPPAAEEPAPEHYDRRVAEASRELARRVAEARLVERGARLIEQMLVLNQDDLALARAAADASARHHELHSEQVASAEAERERLRAADAPAAQQAAAARALEQARRLADRSAATAAADADLVASLESRLESLRGAEQRVAERVARAEGRVDAARRWLDFLRSPLAPHRILRWLFSAGPRVALLLGVFALLILAARRLAHRVVDGMVSRSRYGSDDERRERVDTLQRALRNGLTVALAFLGVLAILPQFGVDVTVLLGGAAVFSLAIAFGAQALVKDYFSGFMVLIENQYRVGNVVRINAISGVVEDVTLRMTTLRDLEGVAHFIPHGQITTVSNLTHGWSRVVLDVGVAYKESVDRVMDVLLELAREMRKDPAFGPLIADEPEMLGVDAFGDSAVVIKLLVRTRPLRQWTVKRELLRRIKNRFDELGIEIPFPHRTVYHRGLDGSLPDGTSGEGGGPA